MTRALTAASQPEDLTDIHRAIAEDMVAGLLSLTDIAKKHGVDSKSLYAGGSIRENQAFRDYLKEVAERHWEEFAPVVLKEKEAALNELTALFQADDPLVRIRAIAEFRQWITMVRGNLTKNLQSISMTKVLILPDNKRGGSTALGRSLRESAEQAIPEVLKEAGGNLG